MAKSVILLGGNIGNTQSFFTKAKNEISKTIGEIITSSSLYETEPWGFTHEQNFLNQVLIIQTDIEPLALLNKTQQIEKLLGRIKKKNQYSERTIDIDILFYDSIILKSERLEIPHPRIQERNFTLAPLCEIMQDYIHPILNKSIKEILNKCEDNLIAKKI